MNKVNLKEYFSRLKNPAVIIGLLGYILTILSAFGIEVDNQTVNTIVQAVSGILILLGILNNPAESGVDVPYQFKDKY